MLSHCGKWESDGEDKGTGELILLGYFFVLASFFPFAFPSSLDLSFLNTLASSLIISGECLSKTR
jgi:hypothetical protein